MDTLFDFSLLRFVWALGVVLIAIWGLIFLAKRFKIFPSSKMEGKYLQILDMLPLDSQRRLIFVSCGQIVVLVLLSPKGDQIIPLSSLTYQEKL